MPHSSVIRRAPQGRLMISASVSTSRVSSKYPFTYSSYILSCCCAEADGITEVVGRQAGHDGIEINDAESFSGLFIEQDVVQLGVVMCDAERKESFLLLFYEYAAVVLSCEDEIDLRTAGRRAVLQVAFQGELESAEAFDRVGEIRNGLIQLGRRVVAQLFQEMAEAVS